MKRPLIVIAGPTAAGKSALAVALAKRINGSVISADSMQVYKYMDIGSAKITADEMEGIPHYLIDEFYPDQEFNIARFQEYAKKYLEEICQQGRIPILAGGTGFYIQSLLYDIRFAEETPDPAYRNQLEELARNHGNDFLHNELRKVDPNSAELIHSNNMKRVIRALEFYHHTGKTISSHNEEEKSRVSPYASAYFVINEDRNSLYQKIDARVDQMMQQGLADEVQTLRDKGYDRNLISMQGLGYKEILAAFDGEITMEDAVTIIKRDTRHFAKRQLTWFRREKEVIWIEKEDFDFDQNKILDYMIQILQERNILQQ